MEPGLCGKLDKVMSLFANFDGLWLVAGGWALDLYLGAVTREHEDVDIAVARADQLKLQRYLAGWDLKVATPHVRGELTQWARDEWLDPPVHEIHASNPEYDPPWLEVLLDEIANGQWAYRRNLAITHSLEKVICHSPAHLPYLCPEVVLLYKAKDPRPQDEADFLAVREALDAERRSWLRQALEACHYNHTWLAEL